MSAAPSILKKIRTIREKLDPPPRNEREVMELSMALRRLLHSRNNVFHNREHLALVLDFAQELEAYRGKGRRFLMKEFAAEISAGSFFLSAMLKDTDPDPSGADASPSKAPDKSEIRACLELLTNHAFQRVQGPHVRSKDAADLRGRAWRALAWAARAIRNPEHLQHALKVAADAKASPEERNAAVEFLLDYWEGDKPDKATIALLQDLEADPPDRRCLVTVMQAQVDFGLNNELGAMDTLDDWDDQHPDQ